MKSKGREAAPHRSTPLLFRSPRASPSRVVPSPPSNVSTEDPDEVIAASLKASYPDLICPDYIWAFVEGGLMSSELEVCYKTWEEELGAIREGDPLSFQQRQSLLALVADGTIKFG